jgi:hypothetical protein
MQNLEVHHRNVAAGVDPILKRTWLRYAMTVTHGFMGNESARSSRPAIFPEVLSNKPSSLARDTLCQPACTF